MGLPKLDKPEPLAKMAFNVLRDSILSNELTTGVVYNEKGLANDLGISRTPVREALLELSSKRLVRFLPQKGVVINTFSNKEVGEVFEVRTTLESLSIHKACLNYKTLDISGFKKCLLNQQNAVHVKNAVEFMAADRCFHSQFTKLTDNNYLVEMMRDVRDIIHLMGFRGLETKGRMQEVIKEHENILKAVLQGNTVDAIQQMEFHLQSSEKAVKTIRQEE